MANSGLPEWLPAAELVGLPGTAKTVRGVRYVAQLANAADATQWVRRQRAELRGGPLEFQRDSLPLVTQAALVRRAEAVAPCVVESDANAKPDLWARWGALPESTRAEADRRAVVVRRHAELLRQGVRKVAALKQVAKEHDVVVNTLYNWLKLVEVADPADWAPLLAPGGRGRVVYAECSPEAWSWFVTRYLVQSCPNIQQLHRQLVRVAAEEGWSIPKDPRSLLKRLEREVAPEVLLLARSGAGSLKQLYPHMDRDRTVFKAMEALTADGHTFDLEVTYKDGSVGRPVLVAVQDLYSGMLVGWALDRSENKDAVRLAFGMAFRKYGLARELYLDNGRAFASKWLTGGIANRYRFKVKAEDPVGILTRCGVEIHWVTPAHGQAKPIERAFGDIARDISRDPRFDGAYVGNRPGARPENARSKLLRFEDFEAMMPEFINEHNARQGRKTAVCAGQLSFAEAFDGSWQQAAPRLLTATQAAMYLLPAEGIAADKRDGSIKLMGNRYWCRELGRYRGRRVVVRFDPANLHAPVYVETLDGRAIGVADCLRPVGFNDRDAAARHARARADFSRGARLQLKAIKELGAAGLKMKIPLVPAPEPRRPKTVEGVFTKPPPMPAVRPRGPDKDFEAKLNRSQAALNNAI